MFSLLKVWMQVNLVPLMKPIPNQSKVIGVRRVKVVPAFGMDLMLLPDWSTGLLPQTTTKHLQVSDMDSIISFKTKKNLCRHILKWFLEVEIFAVYWYVHLYVLQIFQSVKLDLFDLSPLVIFFCIVIMFGFKIYLHYTFYRESKSPKRICDVS